MKTLAPLLLVALMACQPRPAAETSAPAAPAAGSFAHDVDFLKKYKSAIVLGTRSNPARVLVTGDYQGRVMTSSSNGDSGRSHGWMNYNLIASGKVPPHINPVGGEDRFWLGPEGGQYALYFKGGDPFDFDHWQTPALIDSEPFDLVSSDSVQATFQKHAAVTNYSGFTFDMHITRQISLLSSEDFTKTFGVESAGAQVVAYASDNTVMNAGKSDWKKSSGLVSIWILGMFNPSDHTTIILPHEPVTKENNVATDYFGEIPADRIQKNADALLLKGDGHYRGKVGIAPGIAKPVAGSYDPDHGVLTLVQFDLDPRAEYVNSKWEKQQQPFRGDAVNAYNDGPLADGSQMGPFYEIESSSPARELKSGESVHHRVVTAHLEGDAATLGRIAQAVLGVSLTELMKQ